MGFVLKKFISFWLLPLPFCLTLLLCGLWLTRRERRSRFGRGLLWAGAAVLLVLGNDYVSNQLLLPLERRYAPIPDVRMGEAPPAGLAACRYVVVLGSGHGDDPILPATSRLSPSGLARIVEGVRLARLVPAAGLIVSGPPVNDRPSHASVLEAAAVSLGVAPDRIRRIESARDTAAEALAVKSIVGMAPVALVTSAAHLPRAVALFEHAGVDVMPCPADFLARPNADFRWGDLLCDSNSLDRSTWAVRERLGYLWAVLRRQAD